MMRITNAMMTSNTKNNININKLNEDRLNTQIATGQVISRPSEDPVVAIRALRLNTNLSQLTQYYKKNIPDAQAWLNVTETALKQTDQLFANIRENLTAGASDQHTATDRQKILEDLKSLRDELYSSGNADYAERTVFTDYRTQKSLTFLETDKDLDWEYSIHETFDQDSPDTFNYITSDANDETKVTSNEITRIRLSYDKLMGSLPDGKISLKAGDPDADPSTQVTEYIDLEKMSIAGKTPDQVDDIYTYVVTNPGKAVFIPETGEILMGDTAANKYADFFRNNISLVPAPSASVDYNKNSWKSGDLRPEHYFACYQKNQETGVKDYYNYAQKEDPVTHKMITDTSKPDFKNKDMEVEISFNQKIRINTHANEVYTHDIGRDVDDLVKATQDVVDADDKVTALQKKLAAASDADKPDVQKELDAANKECSLKKEKMQKMFAGALDIFAGYSDRNNLAVSNIGSLQSRLSITKERVADQLQSFKELADANINAELTETSIDFSSAKLALEAAQLAAGKIAQQTLLNYL